MSKVEWLIIIFVIVVCSFFFAGRALAKDISFSWDKPTEREDGTALSPEEIQSYRLYKFVDGEAVPLINVSGSDTSYVLNVDTAGSHCYAISTIDSDSREGRLSDQVCVGVVFDPKPPSNVTGLTD